MKTKKYTMQDLSDAMDDRKRCKSTFDRVKTDLEVQQGKVIQLQKELQQTEVELYKHERKILDIIGDLDFEPTRKGHS